MRARRLTIAGIYQTNFSEYDNLFLLTDLSLVNRLNGWKHSQVSGLELQVRHYDKLEDITYSIAEKYDNRKDAFGGVYYVRNIEQLNPQIFCLARLARLKCMGDPYINGWSGRFYDDFRLIDYYHRTYQYDWDTQGFGRK